MDIFRTQLQRAEKIQPQIISRELFEFIRSIRDELIKLNKEQIYEDSSDIYGNAIGFYSAATEAITGGAKQAGAPFDGKSTGNWLDAFYADVFKESISFGSTDAKTLLILSSAGSEYAKSGWLSSDLFGLTDENLNNVIETKLLPFVLNYYTKTLQI